MTTHVLDSAHGRPAAGVPVRLERLSDGGSDVIAVLAKSHTDADGRARDLGPGTAEAGTYRLVLDTGAYFAATGQRGFYPEVAVTFALPGPERHCHVPVLLSPYAYSTYRGS
ncbi:hydroxyisourate hydrolase [Pseudonocardia bannensis]|uniref:5-hydroxyisourate hydrolase n=1 Tax=Pseudonocardia bannensis TaxID=630973 RepID=A0A848DDU5_9PSEU|nr:hydroxyisourate hydrolase [Pseudonocardia bannensis]